MPIRTATEIDREAIRSVHLAAFSEGEGERVSKLAADLLSEKATPPIISFVAEADGSVVGHVAFSPVIMGSNENVQGYILAPLGVKPDHHKRRMGSNLIETGIRQLSEQGVDVLFVYGDPKYYGKFGFSADIATPFVPPYELTYPFGWQGLALNSHVLPTAPVQIACVTSLCDPALW